MSVTAMHSIHTQHQEVTTEGQRRRSTVPPEVPLWRLTLELAPGSICYGWGSLAPVFAHSAPLSYSAPGPPPPLKMTCCSFEWLYSSPFLNTNGSNNLTPLIFFSAWRYNYISTCVGPVRVNLPTPPKQERLGLTAGTVI